MKTAGVTITTSTIPTEGRTITSSTSSRRPSSRSSVSFVRRTISAVTKKIARITTTSTTTKSKKKSNKNKKKHSKKKKQHKRSIPIERPNDATKNKAAGSNPPSGATVIPSLAPPPLRQSAALPAAAAPPPPFALTTGTFTCTAHSASAVMLQQHCPRATEAEIERFLTAKQHNYQLAYQQLTQYIHWRQEYQLDDPATTTAETETQTDTCCTNNNNNNNNNDTNNNTDNDDDDIDDFYSCVSSEDGIDELDWRYASNKACAYYQQKKRKEHDGNHHTTNTHHHNTKHNSKSNTLRFIRLPQLIRIIDTHKYKNKDSRIRTSTTTTDTTTNPPPPHRILHLLPAKLDLSIHGTGSVTAIEAGGQHGILGTADVRTYVLALVYYLETKLDRTSMETLVIAIDVRGGTGWANPSPWTLLPFLKQVLTTLEQNYPERLQTAVIYPMPHSAYVLWNTIQRLHLLDPATFQKIVVVPGPSGCHDPPPNSQLDVLFRERFGAGTTTTTTTSDCDYDSSTIPIMTKQILEDMEHSRISSFC